MKCFIILLAFAFLGCQTVVNKMAFYPDTSNNVPVGKLPRNVQEIFITTKDGVKIQTYFIPEKASGKIVIYFHGNAGNISHRLPDLFQIGMAGVNALGVGYRGYGKSQGKPTEEGIYLDGKAALKYAIDELGFKMENVFIFGRSIGTTVAMNTSQNLHIAGLVLVSPLTSGKEQAKTTCLSPFSFLAGSLFNNNDKAENLICPVLILHGSNDRVIPHKMGVQIYNKIKTRKNMITIVGAGHNDISSNFKFEYWTPIFEFITQ